MIEYLQQLDQDVFMSLHLLVRGQYMDSSMWLVTSRLIWVPMYVVLAWWIIRKFGTKRGIIVIATIGLAVLCADKICADVIRPLVERLRPSNLNNALSDNVNIVNGYRGGRFGFPSCHAANTIVLATYLTLLCRGYAVWMWMFVWALLNCYSRVYLGVHYPGDLIVGGIVGALFAWLWWLAARYAVIRFNAGELVRPQCTWLTPYILTGYVTLAVTLVVLIF